MTNRDTGEQVSVTIEPDAVRGGRNIATRGFAMVWFDDLLDAMIPMQPMRVLLGLTELMNERGEVRYSLDDLAKRTGLATAAVWRCIEDLRGKDMVRKLGRAHVVVNPNVIWKGPISDRSVAMVRWHNWVDVA